MTLIKNKIFIGRIILSGICILFLAVTFHTENRSSGWYQQFLPNLNGRSITDVFFLDSLVGYAVTNSNGQYDTAFVLKTTNGGDNWFINYSRTAWFTGFNKIKFLNLNTGFICGISISGGPKGFTKTTNGGTNWFDINTPDPYLNYLDMSVLNEDTIWLISSESLTGGVFRTTNGGLSWTRQFSGGTENPNEIYMYNARIGFISGNPSPRKIRKTTDGGNSWSIILYNDYFDKMYFSDSLTGWKCSAFGMKKTINGGLNWITQQLPIGGNISGLYINFSNINRDTIWSIGGYILFPNNQIRELVFRTINGGNNWFYQIPDTSLQLGQYWYINFVNNLFGWVNPNMDNKELHTISGGDTTFYSGIQKISNEIPLNYILHQNYPNPFNPRTVIGYKIKKNSFVRLDAYDILGKQVMVLVNEKQSAEKYEVDFMGKFSPSGIYFYRLMVDGKVIDTKKMMQVK